MKFVASKHTTIQHIALFAALAVSSVANAATYDYTGNYAYMRKPAMTSAQRAAQLQVDTETCNDAAGAQYGMPSAGSNVKVAPGHFIDHDAPF
jgi:hypothetical protein